jgi:hypothetical protein
MAKSKFPVVPVLLIGGGALAIYLLTRPKAVPAIPPKQPDRAPGVPPSGIVTPQTPGAPLGQAYTRVRSPYIFQTPGDLNISPMEPPISSEQINRETCLFGGEFIAVTDPRYASIQPPPRIWVTDRYGRQGVCLRSQ